MQFSNRTLLKDNGIHKDVLREILKHVLTKESVTKRELAKVIPGVSMRSVEKELSKHRNWGVLSVSSTNGGKQSSTTVSLSFWIKGAVVKFDGQIGTEELASMLAILDSEMRRFVSKMRNLCLTPNQDDNLSENNELDTKQTKLCLTPNQDDNANKNEGLDTKEGCLCLTPNQDDNHSENERLGPQRGQFLGSKRLSLGASNYYNKEVISYLSSKLKEKRKDYNNGRRRDLDSVCVEKPSLRPGAATVCEEWFGVKHKSLFSAIDAFRVRVCSLWFGVKHKSISESDFALSVLDGAVSLIERLLSMLSVEAKPSPRLDPEPPVETEPPVEPSEPAIEAKRTRKRREPGERKHHKSRKGKSGSFPDSALHAYEELSLTNRHPIYDGLDSRTLDMMFARAYDAIMTKRGKIQFRSIYTLACQTWQHLKDSGLDRHFHKARLRADEYGYPYEDYLEAIFDWYDEMHEKGQTKFRYPYPHLLYGNGARACFETWLDNQTEVPFRRDKAYEEFLPENYKGTEEQKRYYDRMLEHVRRISTRRHIPIHIMLNDLIFSKILSQEFAEDPELNRLLPGYRYKCAA